MAISPLIALRTVFIVLGCVMVPATLIYTFSIDGFPVFTDPWMKVTLMDYFINAFALAAWASYKETSWLTAVVWSVFIVLVGSCITSAYITVQLLKLSNDESMQDLMCHLLLHKWDKKDAAERRSSIQVVTARMIFSIMGCLMLGTLIYTCVSAGSPFNKDNFIPWINATLLDLYVNIAALSVWVGYKESSWVGRIAWIALLLCFRSITFCAYMVRQLFQLSPYDPLYIVLLNKKDRKRV